MVGFVSLHQIWLQISLDITNHWCLSTQTGFRTKTLSGLSKGSETHTIYIYICIIYIYIYTEERNKHDINLWKLDPYITSEPCFFLLFTGCIFSSCLRVADALPTPLRCFPTRGLFVLICLRVPTLTSCFLILPTRLACVASVGFLLVLILHTLPARWALSPTIGASVVSWGCVFCTSGCCYTRLQNTSSNTAYAEKNINQHPQNAYEKPTRASEMPTPALHKTYFV